MRATSRGYIAGVGTTGALVAAAVCAFVVVSAIVAFEGWPEVRLGLHPATLDGSAGSTADPIASARLGAEPAASVPSNATGETRGSARHGAVPAGPGGDLGSGRLAGEAPAVPGEPPAHVPAGGGTGARRVAHGSVTEPSGSERGTDGTPTPTPSPATPGDPTPPPAGGSSGAGTVGATVTQVTGTVGTTITQTGQQLGGTVGATTGQVGTLVGQLSPAVGQTVTQTGQVAGGVVSGATGTVGQVVQGTGQVVGSLLGGLGARKPSH